MLIFNSTNRRIVTVTVLYFIPDYTALLNEFVWQTVDVKPRFPRVHRFLDYWHHEIDAVIKDVTLCDVAYREDHIRFCDVVYRDRSL